MNKTEAVSVMDALKIMFPEWHRWVLALPNKDACIRNWYAAVESQDKEHIDFIVDEWRTGKRACPATYDYERLIFILVAAARELRSQDVRRETAQSNLKTWHQEAEEAQRRRANYKPAVDRPMGNAMRQIKLAADAITTPKSQWTDEEKIAYFRQVDEVVNQFSKILDKA